MQNKPLTLKQKKRIAIINAAKKAFLSEGVSGASMDRIAELAQVSKKTIYNHFESKDHLVIEVLAEQWNHAMQSLTVTYQQGVDLKEQLTALLQEEIAVINSTENIELSKMALSCYFVNPEQLQQYIDNSNKQDTDVIVWIKAAISDHQLKEEALNIGAKQLHSLIKGEAFWPTLFGMEGFLSKAEQQKLAEQCADMFLAIYEIS